MNFFRETSKREIERERKKRKRYDKIIASKTFISRNQINYIKKSTTATKKRIKKEYK